MGYELNAFVTASHGGNCYTAARVDGTSTEGNEPNEKRGLAAGLMDGDWTPERVEAWDSSREMLNAVELASGGRTTAAC